MAIGVDDGMKYDDENGADIADYVKKVTWICLHHQLGFLFIEPNGRAGHNYK